MRNGNLAQRWLVQQEPEPLADRDERYARGVEGETPGDGATRPETRKARYERLLGEHGPVRPGLDIRQAARAHTGLAGLLSGFASASGVLRLLTVTRVTSRLGHQPDFSALPAACAAKGGAVKERRTK